MSSAPLLSCLALAGFPLHAQESPNVIIVFAADHDHGLGNVSPTRTECSINKLDNGPSTPGDPAPNDRETQCLIEGVESQPPTPSLQVGWDQPEFFEKIRRGSNEFEWRFVYLHNMKTFLLRILPLGLIAALFTSCSSYGPNANVGAVLGGVVGAGIGAGVGEHKGRELEGAAIGGALGALAGATLGTSQDQVQYGVPSRSYSSYQQPAVYTQPAYGYGHQRPVVYQSYPRTHVSIGGGYGYSRYGGGYGYNRGYSRGYGGSCSIPRRSYCY